MAKEQSTPKKRSFRWGRMLATLIILGLAGGGLYVASWLNARRYFLVVGATEVRIAKGRMLPVGFEPYIPNEVELRRAYETFPLPSGINVPRGETTFTDRVELDQALFRLLKDCLGYTLSKDDRATATLVDKYLHQIRAIPGTSVSQQIELGALERDASYVTARQKLDEAIAGLKEAARMFRDSAKGAGGATGDGDARAAIIETAVERLEAKATKDAKDAKDAARHDENKTPPTTRTSTNAATSP